MVLGNEILVGKKPLMDYVRAAMLQLNTGSEDIVIKARGNLTAKAVDVAEIIKRELMNEIKVSDVKIFSEIVRNREGITRISAMELVLKKELLE